MNADPTDPDGELIRLALHDPELDRDLLPGPVRAAAAEDLLGGMRHRRDRLRRRRQALASAGAALAVVTVLGGIAGVTAAGGGAVDPAGQPGSDPTPPVRTTPADPTAEPTETTGRPTWTTGPAPVSPTDGQVPPALGHLPDPTTTGPPTTGPPWPRGEDLGAVVPTGAAVTDVTTIELPPTGITGPG